MARTHRDFGRALADPSEERELARNKELRFWVGGSVVAHLGVIAILALAPAQVARPLPAVLSVNLVAGVPAPRAKAAVAKAAPAKPKPAPPKVAPAKPKPVAKAKPKPKPKTAKKVLPKKATPSRPKKVRPRELDFDEALAQLRDEMGEPELSDTKAPADDSADEAADAASSTDAAGTTDAELAAWVSATIRHVRSVYVTPPEFLSQDLVTQLRVTLTASGMVVGTPDVVRSSGNPFWDDNAVRALVRASPLPAPPKSGVWSFAFPSMESR